MPVWAPSCLFPKQFVVRSCDRPLEVVAYFLAVLELARWGAVRLAQEDWLAEIEIHQVAEPDSS